MRRIGAAELGVRLQFMKFVFIRDIPSLRDASPNTRMYLTKLAEKKDKSLQWRKFPGFISIFFMPLVIDLIPIIPHNSYYVIWKLGSIFILGVPLMYFFLFALYYPRLKDVLEHINTAEQDAAANP